MSIEKFNPVITGESVPYTMVCNKVIQNIDNMEAFTVWVYLLSLPKDWNIVKQHVKNHFKIGDQKLKKIFAYLAAHNLIETIRHRDESGRITKFELRILNGTNFTKKPNEINARTTGSEIHPVVHPPSGLQSTTNKTKSNKGNKKKKETKSEGKKDPAHSGIPLDFVPNEKHELLAYKQRIDLQKELGAFIDYYQAHGKVMVDWNAAFSNWLRKAVEFNKNRGVKEHSVTQSIRELKEKSPAFRQFLLS